MDRTQKPKADTLQYLGEHIGHESDCSFGQIEGSWRRPEEGRQRIVTYNGAKFQNQNSRIKHVCWFLQASNWSNYYEQKLNGEFLVSSS